MILHVALAALKFEDTVYFDLPKGLHILMD